MFNVIILGALVKVLIATDKPLLCSSVFAGINFLFNLMFEVPILANLLGTALAFALSSLYFYLLYRTELGSLMWWLILLSGLLFWLL